MSETVTVACKLPAGLLLRLFDWVDDTEPTPAGGSRKVKKAQVRTDRPPVLIKGYNERYNSRIDTPPKATIGHFALTHGVDKDFFEAWLKQNESLPAVRNGLIFAHPDGDVVSGHVKEFEKVKTGLEPLDPQNLPRQFRDIQTADERR